MHHSSRIRSSRIILGLALLCGPLVGCAGSDGLPREAVSGTVTLDGQPLPDGAIQMIPVDKKDGIAAGAIIKDGKYEIEREKGLVPGQYRVVINSGQAPAAAPADGPPGPVVASDTPKELIPSQYNLESTLTADVKAGTPNSFPFDLKSK